MATIKLKRGTSAPTTSNIVDGEVAVDLTSQKLYIRHDSGGSSTIKEIGTGVTGDATFAGSIFTTDLEVRGSGGGSTNRLKATYNHSSGVAAFGPDSGGGSTSLQIGTSNSGTYSTALTVLSDGKIGIGETSPATALDIKGTEASGGVEILLTNVGEGGSNTVPYTAIRSKLNPARNGGEIRFGRDSTYGSAADADSNIQFYTAVNDTNTLALTINSSQNATFAGHIELPDSKYVKLGADGDFILYHDGTSNYIQAVKQDSDIIFRGNYGGTHTNFLTLDTGEAGKATFTNDVNIEGGQLTLGKANTNSAHINSYELMTFNIDSDNDDTNRYFEWLKNGNSGGGTELMRLDEDGDATVYGTVTSYSTSGEATFVAYRNQTTLPNTGDGSNLIGAYLFKSSDSSGTEPDVPPHYAGIGGFADKYGRMELQFFTERDHWDSDPRVPTLTLDRHKDAAFFGNVGVASGGTPDLDTATADVVFQVGSSQASTPTIQIRSGPNGTGQLWFGDNSGNDVGRYSGYIEYVQNDRDMKFGTANNTALTINSSQNATFVGEVAAASLDISGNVDIDGTLETDAFSINGTTVSSTAAELNALDPALKESNSIYIGADPSGSTNSAEYNSAFGVSALNVITTGDQNVAVGYRSGYALTEAQQNTLVGTYSGYSLTTGAHNTYIGRASGGQGDISQGNANTGDYNVTVGHGSSAALTTASYNTVVGTSALANATSGDSNVVMGYKALYDNVDGHRNTAVGYEALRELDYVPGTSADDKMYNVALGFKAGTAATDTTTFAGVHNTFVGSFAGAEFTTGDHNVSVGYKTGGGEGTSSLRSARATGDNNTSVGADALGRVTDGHNNVALGKNAMLNSTQPNHVVAVGRSAGQNITAGQGNVHVGGYSGQNNTTGEKNVSIGYNSLVENRMGDHNTAVGHEALRAMRPTNKINDPDNNGDDINYDTYNSAFGYRAMASLTYGRNNTALGAGTLENTTTGTYNVAVGQNSLQTTESGTKNTAVGYNALQGNKGDESVAVGYNALLDLNTVSGETGTENTAVGAYAGKEISTGTRNVCIGRYAGAGGSSNPCTGDNNTSVGSQAGQYLTLGYENIAIGYRSGGYSVNLDEGFRNILIGVYCDTTATNSEYATGIGYNLDCEGGYTTVGNGGSDIRAPHGTATWAIVSDERYKTDIVDSSAGLNFINALRPRTFRYKTLGELPETFRAYKAGSTEVFKNSKTNHGFIAQEVKAAIDADDSIKDGFTLWDDREDGSQEVAESALIPILVKAIQEQQALIESLTARIAALEAENE